MAYRNELAAAQSRGNALEREVGQLRQQLSASGLGTDNSGWSRRMDRGASEEQRFRHAANREHQRRLAAQRKEEKAEARSKVRAARFQRFAARRRYLRSTTRLGWCAHCFFPWLAISPLLCVFPLYIILPWTLWILLASFMGLLGVWGISNLWASYVATREDVRLEALPFLVEGHHEVLQANLDGIDMTLSFEGMTPTRAQMQRWIYGLATEIRGRALRSTIRNTKIESENGVIVARPHGLSTAWMAGNRSYHVWYRRVVEKALVELHQAFPLTHVRITRAK